MSLLDTHVSQLRKAHHESTSQIEGIITFTDSLKTRIQNVIDAAEVHAQTLTVAAHVGESDAEAGAAAVASSLDTLTKAVQQLRGLVF